MGISILIVDDEKQMVDNQHGAAACMMAVSEQLRRA